MLQGGVPPEDVPTPAVASEADVEAKEAAKAGGCAAPRRTAPRRTAPHRAAPRLTSPHLASPRHASPRLASPPFRARAVPRLLTHDRAHGSAAAGDESDEDGGDGNSEEF